MNAPTFRADGLMDAVRALRPGAAGQTHAGAFFLPALAYETDNLAATIVDRPAEDALAPGFEIEGDPDETVLNECDRLDVSLHFGDAVRWARLHGASAILVLARDGAPLDEPLDPDRLERIDDLLPFPGDAITAEPGAYADPAQRNYGLPERYRLSPSNGADGFTVHESRLLCFGGDPLPRARAYGVRLHWSGRSALAGCMADLDRYRAGLRLAEQILQRKQQPIYGMAGLSELLATAEGKGFVQEKLALVDAVRGLLNTVAIDAGGGNRDHPDGDNYTIIDLALGGIDAVLGKLELALCASARMPGVVLLGQEIRGLGSVGAGEQSVYHGYLGTIRQRTVRPPLERLVNLVWAQRSLRATAPDRWRIKWRPFWSPTEAELADVALKKAQARKTAMEAVTALVDTQLAGPEETRALARATAFPELVEGAPPEPEPELPDDTDETAAAGEA